uniref:hypothetical protein n=1 Tax=Gonatophragmium mori TaxID=2966219 RepID=UPI0023D82605|nr:hypothetical protein P2Z26_mgp03 [Gonatophragmium mori]WCZ71136.1 hypothetical protein [Gonatophragmium mori]
MIYLFSVVRNLNDLFLNLILNLRLNNFVVIIFIVFVFLVIFILFKIFSLKDLICISATFITMWLLYNIEKYTLSLYNIELYALLFVNLFDITSIIITSIFFFINAIIMCIVFTILSNYIKNRSFKGNVDKIKCNLKKNFCKSILIWILYIYINYKINNTDIGKSIIIFFDLFSYGLFGISLNSGIDVNKILSFKLKDIIALFKQLSYNHQTIGGENLPNDTISINNDKSSNIFYMDNNNKRPRTESPSEKYNNNRSNKKPKVSGNKISIDMGNNHRAEGNKDVQGNEGNQNISIGRKTNNQVNNDGRTVSEMISGNPRLPYSSAFGQSRSLTQNIQSVSSTQTSQAGQSSQAVELSQPNSNTQSNLNTVHRNVYNYFRFRGDVGFVSKYHQPYVKGDERQWFLNWVGIPIPSYTYPDVYKNNLELLHSLKPTSDFGKKYPIDHSNSLHTSYVMDIMANDMGKGLRLYKEPSDPIALKAFQDQFFRNVVMSERYGHSVIYGGAVIGISVNKTRLVEGFDPYRFTFSDWGGLFEIERQNLIECDGSNWRDYVRSYNPGYDKKPHSLPMGDVAKYPGLPCNYTIDNIALGRFTRDYLIELKLEIPSFKNIDRCLALERILNVWLDNFKGPIGDLSDQERAFIIKELEDIIKSLNNHINILKKMF